MNGANGLFNSTILDVGLGLVFIYLLLAVITSALNEWVASWLNLRSSNLKSAIKQLLDNQSGNDPNGNNNQDANWFLSEFYNHPLVAGMHNPDDASHPSYLSSRTFANVVMDVATPEVSGSITFENLETGLKKLPDGDVKTALLAVIQNADHKLPVAQQNIERWYDDTMQRMGGWYKKKIHLITVSLAVLLVVGTNADTVRMSYILWRNPTQRAQIVENAKARAQQAGGNAQDANNSELQNLDNLLGWETQDKTTSKPDNAYKFWGWRILGWFLTIVAVSLGAPFWFDLLNKVVNLRNTGVKPKPSADPPASETTPTTPATLAVVAASPGTGGQAVAPIAPQPQPPGQIGG